MSGLLKRYLREKLGMILLFAGMMAICLILHILYQLQLEAFYYGAMLCGLLLVLYLLLGFLRYVRRHRTRQSQLASLDNSWSEMETPLSLEEEEYQEMVLRLGQRCRELTTSFQTEQQESLDYYTTWAHQIKTPIAVMRMILQSEDTEDHRELLAELFRIEQYVEMVLSFIRLGSDSKDFVFGAYPLDSILRQSIRKYAPQFIRRRIRLIYGGTDAVVVTDEKWLSFLVEQILSNAVKYTISGSVTISVTPEQELVIQDTGIGIAPEDLPRIFEKGFTGYNGRADRKSTGLGLYLCKQTADRLGCRIWAESEVGRGTAVHVALEKNREMVRD